MWALWLGSVLFTAEAREKGERDVRAQPEAARSAAGLVVEEGPLVLRFEDGVLVPLAIGDERLGVAFRGTATVEIRVDAADAAAIANRQVLWYGAAADDWRGFVGGEPLVTSLEHGYLGAPTAVVDGWLADRQPVAAPDDATLRKMLADAQYLGPSGRDWRDFELVIGTRLGFVRPDGAATEEDRRINLFREDDEGWTLYALGDDKDGNFLAPRIASEAWVEPPAPPPDAIRGWYGALEPVRVDVDIDVQPSPAFGQVGVTGRATFYFRAHKPLEWFELAPPPLSSDRKGAVTAIVLDGATIAVPTFRTYGSTKIRPSAPLAEGEHTLEVTWTDLWPMHTGMDHAGAASGLRYAMPTLAGSGWPFRVRVAVPEDSGFGVAASGITVREWTADGRRWTESETDGTPEGVWVGIGEWVTRTEPPVDGLPAVRVHLFRDEADHLEEFPPFTRTIVAYYQQVLPAFPTREIEVFQRPDAAFGFVWQATPGLVSVQQMRTYGSEGSTRALEPNLEAFVLAHEIAHQWWGGLVDPAREEDRWIAETYAEVYACLFAAAAFGPKDCAVRQQRWRKDWETSDARAVASLRGAWGSPRWRSIAYDYGPYVFGYMLRGRIGDQAFFAGLDAYAATVGGREASTDTLQKAFEATSQQDLGPFFDYWVTGGFVPKLELTVDGATLTVRSDVPFGTVQVPVRLVAKDGAKETVWIDVVDGVGTLTVPTAPHKALLDPDGLVLARSRKVR